MRWLVPSPARSCYRIQRELTRITTPAEATALAGVVMRAFYWLERTPATTFLVFAGHVCPIGQGSLDASPIILAFGAVIIGIWAVIGAVIAGSVVGYEVCVHCDFSCKLFYYPQL